MEVSLYMLTCTFAGHREALTREDEFRVPRALMATLGDLLERDDEFCFYFGGMGWFDHLSAQVAHRMKLAAPLKRIRLVLVQPYARRVGDRELYDEVIVPECLRNLDPRAAIPERNRWLVEQSQMLIAYVHRPDGGAATTLRYARQLDREVRYV